MPKRSSGPKRGKDGWLLGAAGVALIAGLVFAFLPKGQEPPVTDKPPVTEPIQVAIPGGFPRGSGKIAIVLDDWGYTMKQVPAMSTIRRPLTIAVLPGLPHSGDVARAAQASGHEVILHMPMEARDPAAPREAVTIRTGMRRDQVADALSRSLATVPFARGINNHQGSRATSDRTVMESVLGEVKRRNLYFLDSFVTDQSVCSSVARDLKLRFARRSVFLDNSPDPEAIRQHLAQLAAQAAKNGAAIGIGHDRPNTLQVLAGAIPALEQAGYRLVPVSELVETPSEKR